MNRFLGSFSRLLLLFVVLLLLVVFATGCPTLSKEIKTEIHTLRVTMEAFVQKMDEGVTTREHEQAMLWANYESWLSVDYVINDDKDAKKKLDELEKQDE